jgi:Ca2+/Na+ antiporter
MNWKKVITYSAVGIGCVIGVLILMWLVNLVFPINIYLNIAIQAFLLAALLLIMLYQSVRTGTEKLIICSVTALVWLIAVYVFYGSQLFSGKSEAKVETVTTQPTNDELANANAQWANAIAERDNAQNELSNASERIDSLKKALNKCKGIKEPLTPEEEIALLKREVAALKKAPRSSYAPAPKKNDVTETQFASNQFGATGNYQKTVDNASDSYGGAKVTYAGNIPADSKVGTTVTADRFRLYYVKDSYLRENGLSIPAPRLNGTSGPEFTYDASTGYWYYLDTNTVLSPSMVNSWDYTVIWCIYIGRIGTWDAFLPHESMKAMMKKVRGREDGAVTMDELYKMQTINSDVWTDQNKNGLLMPKSFNPISGEREKGIKRGPEDGLEYQGWDFRTRTTGTVTTEKVNGSSYNSSTK